MMLEKNSTATCKRMKIDSYLHHTQKWTSDLNLIPETASNYNWFSKLLPIIPVQILILHKKIREVYMLLVQEFDLVFFFHPLWLQCIGTCVGTFSRFGELNKSLFPAIFSPHNQNFCMHCEFSMYCFNIHAINY